MPWKTRNHLDENGNFSEPRESVSLADYAMRFRNVALIPFFLSVFSAGHASASSKIGAVPESQWV
jgi:hypothetical protein